ncbi:MAG: hypothetical protein LQ350_005744 [Teloschistes chrysophthalmus]|nr:MAG: hypothetical protein LQ350_005744 [Niorma chrysophthalma]
MVTLPPPQHPPPPDYYRHPPYDMYQGHPQDPHRGPPPPHHMYPQHQPAPRQRTAIACRYCRRRKVSAHQKFSMARDDTDPQQIRCSGFEASEDGRCTNCQRFQQECIFTPVSSHASAFVPAHTAYPHLRNAAPIPNRGGGRPLYPQQPPAIYGAHGQPLGMPIPGQDPNYPPPPHGYPPMAPQGHPYGPQMYDERGHPPPSHGKEQVSRKRPRLDDSPNSSAAPPLPQTSSSHPYHHEQGRPPAPSGRRGSGGQYEYPDPTGLVPVSPASSVTSYQSAPYSQPPGQQPYYPPPNQAVRRASPPSSAYSYEQRASGSPHGSTSSAATYTYPPAGLHPPQVLPPREKGRTPPPRNNENSGNGNGQRGKMGIHDLLAPGDQSGGRTSADTDMVKQLDRKGM